MQILLFLLQNRERNFRWHFWTDHYQERKTEDPVSDLLFLLLLFLFTFFYSLSLKASHT